MPSFTFLELKKTLLDYGLHLPSVDLDSKFTGVVASAKIAESNNLVWPNRKLVASGRSHKRVHTTILNALTHDPAQIPTLTEFRLPAESSEPCSYPIKKWKFLVLYQNRGFHWLFIQ